MSLSPARHPGKQASLVPRVKVWLEAEGRYAFGFGLCEMLQAVDKTGSIKQAAARLGKSYSYVWGRIKEAAEVIGAAARAQCLNNLKQMGVALHNYHGVYQSFPPGLVSKLSNPNWVMPAGNCNAEAPDLGPGWSFFAFMLPYVEQDTLYRSIRFDLPLTDPANDAARRTLVKTYVCPSDTLPKLVKVYDCGNPPSVAAAPGIITDTAVCSYVGILGGGMDNPPDANYA